jgi:hypothetical protein
VGGVAGPSGPVPAHQGTDLGQFKNLSTQIVVTPAEYKSGDVIYPYEMAK